MKVKVISVFQDKFTKQMYKVGDVLDFEDDARVEDLVSRGLVEAPEEKKEVKISLFEKEFEKKALVEALKAIGEKGAMNMKDETLLEIVSKLDKEKTDKLKEALGV